MMNNKTRKVMKASVLLLLFTLLTGCAATSEPKKRFFWPGPPERPRIEWLGAYHSGADLKARSFGAGLLEAETPLSLSFPYQIAADGQDRVYVSDQKAGAVMVFDFVAKTLRVLGEDAGMKPVEPTGVAIDAEGKVYVADGASAGIYVYGKDLRLSGVLSLKGLGIKTVGGMAIDQGRKRLIFPDIRKHRLFIMSLDGAVIKTVDKESLPEKGQLNYPNAVNIESNGNILVSDQMNARIVRLSPEGAYLSDFGTRGDGPGELAVPKGVACDSEGHIYVTDGKTHKVSIFDEQGRFLLDFGAAYSVDGPRLVPGGFLIPQGIYIDKKDTIFIVDSSNERFQRFQYVNDLYLKQNPYTDEEVAKEPAKSLKKSGK